VNKEQTLKRLAKAIEACEKCRLHKSRVNAAPGEGNVNSEIVFVGEALGEQEAKLGRPFVGRAGKLLEELLQSISLKRDEVWITNVVKDRPPENRNPMVDEVRACSPYLDEEIKIIGPKLIIPLGKFATEYFIKDGKISRDHGVPKRVKNYIIYPLYHPAAGLRSTQVAKILKSDFKKIPKVLAMDINDVDYVDAADKDENQMSLL